MDRRSFFGSVGALFGIGAAAQTQQPEQTVTRLSPCEIPPKPWHTGPYIVEVWKPFSNPTIYNYTALNKKHPVEFDTLKQASNWAEARKVHLQREGVGGGKILIRSTDKSVVQNITWGPNWTTSTVYVDGPGHEYSSWG